MRRRIMMVIFLELLFLSSLVFAGIKGGIKGQILDEKGKPISGALVTIISVDYPSEQYKLTTGKKGEFIQIGLDPGYYRVRCEKDAYQPTEEQIKVPMNEFVEKNLTLRILAEPARIEEVPGKNELNEANRFFQEGRYEEALAAYEEAAAGSPQDAIIQYNIGVTLLAMERVEEAVAALKKTIDIQPENIQALKTLGQIYGKMRLYEECVKFYSLATKISSSDPEAFFNLGVAQMNLGNREEALEAFQKSISCDEKYADSYYQLGLIFLNQGRKEEALTALEKFLRLAPEDSKAGSAAEMIKIIKKKEVSSLAI